MNGKIEVLMTEPAIFPVKPHQERVSVEANAVGKIEETIVTEARAVAARERFTRLKKSLRKRSRSIL
ncbi:MAG TPA: hypothetical protein VIL74_13215 [Pyrinomonadaceae bacterium]|jgi:hypothetical protein